MKKIAFALSALVVASTSTAQDTSPQPALSPNQIVEAAPPQEWVGIPAEDLLVMTLAPDRDGSPRKVVIQLIPAPFSQGWVQNIRTLARAQWYDGITVNRVQDNYVVQWGDPNVDNPEAEGEAKPLPEGLKVMDPKQYAAASLVNAQWKLLYQTLASGKDLYLQDRSGTSPRMPSSMRNGPDDYASEPGFSLGFPVTRDRSPRTYAPVHCYGMVGVGRGYSPDTGSGAELYTVIGHAPRHLDRNIALVGRIVEGMEHLSSLPRGSGDLGFYTAEEVGKRTPIVSVRVASDIPAPEQTAFEYLSTEGEAFAKYADARANRRDPFFIVPAGGADICNIPVPVRRAAS